MCVRGGSDSAVMHPLGVVALQRTRAKTLKVLAVQRSDADIEFRATHQVVDSQHVRHEHEADGSANKGGCAYQRDSVEREHRLV